MIATHRRQALASAMSELPAGCGHAFLTCLREWEAGRLPAAHLVGFVRSVAWQSPALLHLRPSESGGGAPCGRAELLSPAEMQELLSAGDGTMAARSYEPCAV